MYDTYFSQNFTAWLLSSLSYLITFKSRFREKLRVERMRNEVAKSREEMMKEKESLVDKNEELQTRHDAIEETLADLENETLHKSKEITQWYQFRFFILPPSPHGAFAKFSMYFSRKMEWMANIN